MADLRLFLDEDIHGALTDGLRKAGVDVESTPEAGRRGKSDQSQLEWADSNGRAIVTYNVAHFVQLHMEWLASGSQHSGIIVSSQFPSVKFCADCSA